MTHEVLALTKGQHDRIVEANGRPFTQSGVIELHNSLAQKVTPSEGSTR